MPVVIITKKKLEKIKEEYVKLEEKVNFLIENVSVFSKDFTELQQTLFAEETELSEEEQKELEQQAQEQLEQMKTLIKNSFKESISEIMSNEEMCIGAKFK